MKASLLRGFNPRPREGATLARIRRFAHDPVSIHAPAKGRPPWSAARSGSVRSFNPRPREGATSAVSEEHQPPLLVSIHAPAKGRRPLRTLASTPSSSFNPRPREGATPAVPPAGSSACRFQSTPPRRGDRDQPLSMAPITCFNPRPREGATMTPHPIACQDFKFQSTPPRRGDRRRTSRSPRLARVSIHAPAKGRRRDRLPVDAVTDRVSIHAPAKGRRDAGNCRIDVLHCFNPRPREGGDRSDGR